MTMRQPSCAVLAQTLESTAAVLVKQEPGNPYVMPLWLVAARATLVRAIACDSACWVAGMSPRPRLESSSPNPPTPSCRCAAGSPCRSACGGSLKPPPAAYVKVVSAHHVRREWPPVRVVERCPFKGKQERRRRTMGGCGAASAGERAAAAQGVSHQVASAESGMKPPATGAAAAAPAAAAAGRG